MTEQISESAIQEGYGRDIVAAQEMTDWFPDYLYGVVEVPGELPQLTVERLVRQFGAGDSVEQLARIRDALMIFDEAHQSNLASYFCGYPIDALKAFEDEVPFEHSLTALDEAFPPVSYEDLRVQLEVLRAEREARMIERRQAALARQAAARTVVALPNPRVRLSLNDDVVSIRTTVIPSLAQSIMGPGEYLEWQNDALCAQTDPELFFPDKGGSTRPAKNICDACEVKDDCLAYAVKNDEKSGIWGGLSSRELNRYKKTGEKPGPRKKRAKKQAKNKATPIEVEPFQRQIKRTEHFVELVKGNLDPDLFDSYNDHPEQMARVTYELLRDVYPERDTSEVIDRVRRLETYFLHKKWNLYQDEFGGHGRYWDLLKADLTDIFSRVTTLRQAFLQEQPDIDFVEYYAERAHAAITGGGAASERYLSSFTFVHVKKRPKQPSQRDIDASQQYIDEEAV